ncbi:MAG TPA: hypothetical protein VNC11_10850 [Gemmatimonadaceae bacterium]|nr:hypothetical protein [Gemmatimonadaceae bacterium]
MGGVLRFTLLLLSSAVVACTSRNDARVSAEDTSLAEVPPPPESVAAREAAITHGPPICPRRPGSTLITSKGIGPASLGITLDSLNKLCTVRDSTVRADEGQPANGRAISVGEGSAPILLFIDDAKKTLTRATTTDPFFRTKGGVGVGSLMSDLRQNHGKKICGDLGPTGIDVWSASLPGVTLGTTAFPLKMPGKGSGLKRDASAVPDTAQITTISVSTPPRTCSP